MSDVEPTGQSGIGWLFALVIVILIAAGVYWWMTGTPSDAPAADGSEVGMVSAPAPLPRT